MAGIIKEFAVDADHAVAICAVFVRPLASRQRASRWPFHLMDSPPIGSGRVTYFLKTFPIHLPSWVREVISLLASLRSILALWPCFDRRCKRFPPSKSVSGLPLANSYASAP